MRKLMLLAALLAIVLVAAGPARGQDIVAQAGGEDVMAEVVGGGPTGTTPVSGGPVVLAGIDAEDGGASGFHGPIANYQQLANTTLSQTSNGGSGILVVGGGKSLSDDVTLFWDAVVAGTPESVTYVNGAANIATQPFSGFRLIAVASDASEASDGLTTDEHDALTARQSDIATFVDGGGGLIGFSSLFDNPYAYLGGLGSFAISDLGCYVDITPTPEGMAVGVTDALDLGPGQGCWHQVFDSFPSFLRVLATHPDGRAAAIGGAQVTVTPTQPCLEARAIAGGATARADCP